MARGAVCGGGGWGCAWQGDMHGRGCVWWGACMEVGMACMAGETATAAGGTHPTEMHSC